MANPFFKAPYKTCKSTNDWSSIDLELVQSKFWPRTKYKIINKNLENSNKDVICEWDKINFIDHWKLSYRAFVNLESDRSLFASIYPPGVAHINGINSIVTKSTENLLIINSLFSTIIYDGYLRIVGKQNLHPSIIGELPLLEFGGRKIAILSRLLGLICQTEDWAKLWEDAYECSFNDEYWTSGFVVRKSDYFPKLTDKYNIQNALKKDILRRQALIELDVLVAQLMNLKLYDLLNLYRIKFTMMRNNELQTYYDSTGRIIYTTNDAIKGIGLPRVKNSKDAKIGIVYRKNGYDVGPEGLGFEDVKDMTEGFIEKTFPDISMSDTPVMTTVRYVAPFFKMDREKDYEIAWKVFEERFGKVNSASEAKDSENIRDVNAPGTADTQQ